MLEFIHDGEWLTSNSALHVGVQLQIRSKRYPDAARIWINRSKVLALMTEHLEGSGTQVCGLIAVHACSEVILSCLAVFPGNEGIILPTTLGEIAIRWQHLSSLVLFREWGGFSSPQLGSQLSASWSIIT